MEFMTIYELTDLRIDEFRETEEFGH